MTIMYYPDLTPYEYTPGLSLSEAINFGWLEPERPFNTGPVPAEAIAKLKSAALRRPMNRYRGTHPCGFCDDEIWLREPGGRRLLGSAEVWIPSQGTVFIAPDLVIHYIMEHHYQLPEMVRMALAHLSEDVSQWDLPDLSKE